MAIIPSRGRVGSTIRKIRERKAGAPLVTEEAVAGATPASPARRSIREPVERQVGRGSSKVIQSPPLMDFSLPQGPQVQPSAIAGPRVLSGRAIGGPKPSIIGTTKVPVNKGVNYTIKSGDTLSSIGKRFGIPWQQIYSANKGVIGPNPNLIFPGTTLNISGGKSGSIGGVSQPGVAASKGTGVRVGASLNVGGSKSTVQKSTGSQTFGPRTLGGQPILRTAAEGAGSAGSAFLRSLKFLGGRAVSKGFGFVPSLLSLSPAIGIVRMFLGGRSKPRRGLPRT